MNSRFNRKLKVARSRFNKTVKIQEQQIREEVLVAKLEQRLGKSKNEVKSLLSEGLISLLAQVPFSLRTEKN